MLHVSACVPQSSAVYTKDGAQLAKVTVLAVPAIVHQYLLCLTVKCDHIMYNLI